MTKSIVSLTFDDGYKSAITSAFPLLQKYGIEATFYIISDAVFGKDPQFMSDKMKDRHPVYMDRMGLATLRENGMEIGAHTRSHKRLPEITPEEAWQEISGGKADLEAQGFSTQTFAYPYGAWTPEVVKQVKEAGFLCARSIIKGTNDPDTDPYLLHCMHVNIDTQIEEIKSWVDKNQGWTILMFHQIENKKVLEEKGWIYGTTPEILEQTLRYLKEIQSKVVTVEKGIYSFQKD